MKIKYLEHMKKSYPATLNNLKKIRATIKDFLKIYEVDLKIIKNKTFLIHLYDNGVRINKKKIKPRNLKAIKPGGLGSYFINHIMDEVKWEAKSKDWINHLILVKKIY